MKQKWTSSLWTQSLKGSERGEVAPRALALCSEVWAGARLEDCLALAVASIAERHLRVRRAQALEKFLSRKQHLIGI